MEAQRTLTDELAEKHPEAIKFIRDNYPMKEKKDSAGKVIKVQRNAKTTWKAFYCQQYEATSRDVIIGYCKVNGIPHGPTQHDGIAISKTYTDGRPVDSEAVAKELTLAVSEKAGFEMVVEAKPMYPTPVIDESRFTAAMFSSNYDCGTLEHFEQSLVGYKTLLSRYFVKVLRHEKPTCVEIILKDNEPSEFIIRSCKACMEIYSGLMIATTCKPKKRTMRGLRAQVLISATSCRWLSGISVTSPIAITMTRLASILHRKRHGATQTF